jgi:hypothetical protein
MEIDFEIYNWINEQIAMYKYDKKNTFDPNKQLALEVLIEMLRIFQLKLDEYRVS